MTKHFFSLCGASLICASVMAQTPENRSFSREDFTEAAESTVNGVVSVKSFVTPTYRQQSGPSNFFNDPFFEFFFGQPSTPRYQQPKQSEHPRERQLGLGSGVIVSADGYIVTNNHVIENAERLEVTLNDNRNFDATVVGADPTTDLALIKIDAPDLHVIPMGDSEKLRVGEWVLAVGNPFGFTSSVTAGIVSAKARNISSSTRTPSRGGIESYIQTDAAVNQGNSGGALVNLDGELVGINTAIYSQNGAYVGCSFAIPTSIVSKVIDDIQKYGTVQRAFLGVLFTELTPEIIAEEKIEGAVAGIHVNEVQDRSAAREAGIKKGDIIVEINGHPTLSTAQLQEIMARLSPGDMAEIKIVRDGKNIIKNVTLRNQQGDTSLSRPGRSADLGCAMSELNKELADKLEISSGVVVDEVTEGRFRNAGILPKTVILSVNSQSVSKPADVERIYREVSTGNGDKVLFIKALTPAGKQTFYAVPLTD